MSNNIVIDGFKSLLAPPPKLTITEEKILVPYESYILDLIKIIGYLILPFIILISFSLMKYCSRNTLDKIIFIYYLLFMVFYFNFCNSYKVIDFNNQSFYSLITIFS